MYKAHINDTTGEIQTVKEHCEGVACLCRDFAIEDLKDIMYVIGLFHDIGKYQCTFQRRINGENIRVEHSVCGAIAAKEKYDDIPALLMGCCIAGHHGGIPDMGYPTDTEDFSTLRGRLKRKFDDYSIYKDELSAPLIDNNEFLQFLLKDCNNSMDKCIDKFSFITRYCYSCLVDADSLDAAALMNDEDRGTLES